MKKILFIGLFLILMSFFVNAELLRFSMINQDPDPVLAGDAVEARFKVENLWENTKNDVKVEIVQEYPFSIYESSTIKDLGRIAGKKEGSDPTFFSFKLKVDPDAVDGNHEIVLIIHDGNYTAYKLENMFYIDVKNEKISVKPYITASDLIISGTSGKFTIEIANAGGEDIKSLELQLLNSGDYKLLSTSDYVYIGDLKADDTESEDFKIYVDESIKTVKIPVKLSYRVNDKDYEQSFNLVLNLLTKDEAKKVGLIKTSYTPYIVMAIVVLVLTFFVVRKFRKR